MPLRPTKQRAQAESGIPSGLEALERLREGNRRFASGRAHGVGRRGRARRAALVAGQKPFAIVLGCSDSRVPPEIIFDQGLGDLFVVRIAGNVATDSQSGSVEFAVQELGTRLVVVLGHTRCGAVLATLEQLSLPPSVESECPAGVLDDIRLSVEPLLAEGCTGDPATLEERAIRANVLAAVERLRAGSPLLRKMVQEGELVVVGAEYSLETGVARFYDEDSGAARREGETGDD